MKLQGNGAQGTTGRPGLKKQQSIASERRILSDISNTKSLSSFGTPKPSPKPGLSVFRSENNVPSKVPQSSSQKPAARAPLRNIVNGSQPAASSARAVKQPSQKKKADYKFHLTPEQLRQADEWAKEDLPIEQTHFTGQDMDALREKIVDAGEWAFKGNAHFQILSVLKKERGYHSKQKGLTCLFQWCRRELLGLQMVIKSAQAVVYNPVLIVFQRSKKQWLWCVTIVEGGSRRSKGQLLMRWVYLHRIFFRCFGFWPLPQIIS